MISASLRSEAPQWAGSFAYGIEVQVELRILERDRQATRGVGCRGDPRDPGRRPARPPRRPAARRAGRRRAARRCSSPGGAIVPRADPRRRARRRRRGAAGDRPGHAADRGPARPRAPGCVPERVLGHRPRRGRAVRAAAARRARRRADRGGAARDRSRRGGVARPGRRAARRRRGPLVAICMATYEPAGRPASSARSTRSARRRTATGSASSATTARDPERFAAIEAASRRRPALRRLALAARGSASTATSSGRSRWRRPARTLVAMADQDDAWYPDKLEALLRRARRRAARLQRRADRRPRRRVDRRDLLEHAGATTTPTCSRCWWPTASPARHRCSAGSCSTTRCPSRPPSSRTSTTTGSR